MDTVADPNSDPISRWLKTAVLGLTVMSCAVSLSNHRVDPDLWGHVQYGRDALQHGLPRYTSYSYTAAEHRWINHEILAELLLAWGSDWLGGAGLLACQSLLAGLLLAALVWCGRRRGLSTITICLLAHLVAFNLSGSWVLRPQLLSFVYYTGLLCLLAWSFQGWEGQAWPRRWDRTTASPPVDGPVYAPARLNALWLSPLLMLLWANSHGGFVAGFAVFTAYLILRSCEALVCRGRAAWGLVGWFATIAIVSGCATLLNPYGVELHLWLAKALGVPRPEINDFRPPDLLTLYRLPLCCLLVVMFVSALFTRRPRDLTHLILLLLTLWQALSHRRHIPFFVIPCGIWMAPHVDCLIRRCRLRALVAWLLLPASRQRAAAGFIVAMLLLQAAKVDYLTSAVRVHRRMFPVSAFQFIEDQQLKGKLVVPYNWGQYALAAFGEHRPGRATLQVSVDGRFRTCYPQHVLDMNFDFQAGPRGRRHRESDYDDERVLQFGEPDLALLYRGAAHSVNVMFRNQAAWTLLYQDQLAQLWGRTERFGDPASRDFIPDGERSISDAPQSGWVAWPAFPQRRRQDGLASQAQPERGGSAGMRAPGQHTPSALDHQRRQNSQPAGLETASARVRRHGGRAKTASFPASRTR